MRGWLGGSSPELLVLAVLLGQPGLRRDKALEALAAPSAPVGCHLQGHLHLGYLQHPAEASFPGEAESNDTKSV